MKCSVCKEEMIILELNRVEVDYCVSCNGIWLDSGELELLLEESVKKNKLSDFFTNGDDIKESKKVCPVCLKSMDKVIFSSKRTDEKKVITLDKCPDNHGLWFDKGELRDLIDNIFLDEENKIIDLLNDMFFLEEEK